MAVVEEAGERREWIISGMDCGSCAAKVRGAVERLPGVSQIQIATMTERLSLTLDPAQTRPEQVETAVKALGYGIAPRGTVKERKPSVLPGAAPTSAASPVAAEHIVVDEQVRDLPEDIEEEPTERELPWYRRPKGHLVIGTGLLLGGAWGFELLISAEAASWAFVVATLIGLAPVARRAFAAARAGMPFTIEMLMTIAALGALVIDAAEEAALVVLLFAVGEVLESVAANRARSSIRALSSLVPRRALLEDGGAVREVDADSLRIGQTIFVLPGNRIPADGEILEGTSEVDESPVTGESMPKLKGPGDAVFAGSINDEAALHVRVTRAAEDNTIARIIRLVEEAESARAPTERFIDRFSRVYMPAVVGVALLVAVVPPLAFGQDWGTWVYRALALLLIGCPCALVISVPASIASALSAGARRGLLMKGGAVIEATAKTTRVAFDKTGTLTMGRPQVTDVVPFEAETSELLAVAAAVEAGSSHPLAEAITARAKADGAPLLPSSGSKALTGKGVEAVVAGESAWVGSPRLADEMGVIEGEGVQRAITLEAEGKTVVVVFRPRRALGLLALRDEPREDAKDGIRQLRSLGVSSVMLTGDNARIGAAIAESLVMEHRAELMPDDKVMEVRRMAAAGGVMMVGDGINDAPALASANVGVAMGSGTDVALETADAALLRNRVTDVAAQIRLARATMGNIRQNIAIALGLKGLFLMTTIFGLTGLWIAILADTGATVLVTLNALRVLAFNPEREV